MASQPTYNEFNAAAGNPGPAASGPADLQAPPEYHEQRDDPGEILEPTIFILGDRFIYSESLSNSPRFQLSRVIHAQGEATNTIKFERVEARIRALADGTVSVTDRGRHLYDLYHYNSELFASDFKCGLEAVTSKGIGKAMIKKSPFPHSGFRVTRVPGEMDKKTDKSAYLYVIKERKDTFEWTDSNGKMIATEVCRDGQPMLLVGVPLTRRRMDGLVALWCLWMWHVHIEKIKTPSGWSDVKRVMQRSREQNGGAFIG